MQLEAVNLEQMESAYRAAVEEWIAAMREPNPKQADSQQERARKKAKAAKREYETAARLQFYAVY